MIFASTCPGCGVSLLGDEIPEHLRDLYGGRTHYWRAIIVKQVSFTALCRCPDCGQEWVAER